MLAKIWLAVRTFGGVLRAMVPIGAAIVAAITGMRTTADTQAGSAVFDFNARATIGGSVSFRPTPGGVGYGVQQVSGQGHNRYFVYSSINSGAMSRRATINAHGNVSPQVSGSIGTQNAAATNWFNVTLRRCNTVNGVNNAARVNGIAFRI